MKSGSPSRTTAAHKTQTKIPGLVLSPLPLLSLLLLFLPELLRGTRDRWVAQVSFIIIHSTGLAPFPRLSAPPHSSHTPIAPRRPGGTHETALYSPPPPSPGGSPSGRPRRTWGVRTDEARERRRKDEEWQRRERGERKKKKSRSGSRTHCRSVLNQLSGSLAVPCDGTGPLWWTARCPFRLLAAGDGSSSRGQPAASPPFPAPPPTWRMAAGSGPLANGGDSSAPSRMAATPPRPRSTAASLPSHLFFFCSSTTAAGSHWRSPPLPAARSPQHRDPTQQRGLSDSVSLLPPGLRHQCNAVRIYGKKEAGTGEHSKHI